MSQYCRLKETWVKQSKYNLNCGEVSQIKEDYVPPVTLSLQDWRDYVISGKNTLYGDAIIPGGTDQIPWGSNSAVYSGHVRQGRQGWGM